MNQVTNYIAEIEQRLLQKLGAKHLPHSEAAQRYLNTKLKVIGMPVPAQRQLAKEGFSFSALAPEQQLKIWEKVFYKGEFHEIKSQALFFAERNFKQLDKKLLWGSLKGWIRSTDNWAHSDALSGYYSRLLETHREMVFPQLQQWNSSGNLWERRQSVVSLLYYQRSRKKFLPCGQMEKLIENLLEDKEYYVQKGVGWALRELRQVYKKETDRFLDRHLERISATAFSAAAEHMRKSEKERLKQRRKQARSGTA